MRFPPALERRFERDTAAGRCRDLTLRGILGLVLFNVFLLSDWQLMPDQMELALWLRLGIVTPLALAILLYTRLQPPALLREALQAIILVLVAAVPSLLIDASTSPLRDSGHFGVLLVVMFATMVQRIRFWFVVAAVVVISVMYLATLLSLDSLAGAERLSIAMVFMGGVIFSLLASYSLEREQRLTYLFGLRERGRNADLEAISRRDPLTGLGNRRSLDEALRELSGNEGEEVAVLLLDVDRFKAYNDTLGHQSGDACLRHIAELIETELRSGSDRAFRFGGEEFLLLLRRTDMADAVFIAERVRRAIERAALPHPAAPESVVTVSLGVAASTLGKGSTLDDLIADADAALYRAKRDGRNRIAPLPEAPAQDVHDRIWREAAG